MAGVKNGWQCCGWMCGGTHEKGSERIRLFFFAKILGLSVFSAFWDKIKTTGTPKEKEEEEGKGKVFVDTLC